MQYINSTAASHPACLLLD